MLAAELIIGVVGASVSLGSGLLKTLKKHAPRRDSGAVVTIDMGETIVQKRGTLQLEDVSKVLDLVDDTPPAGRTKPVPEDSH